MASVDPIIEQIQKINDEYFEIVGRSLKKASKLSPKTAHQIVQIKMTSQNSLLDIERRLASISGKTEAYIHDLLEQTAKENLDFNRHMMADKYVPYEDNVYLQRIVDSLASQMTEEFMNYTANTAWMKFDNAGNKIPTTLTDAYNSIMDRATQALVTGRTNFYSEMRRTVKAVADSGGCRTLINPKPLHGRAGEVVDYATKYNRRLDTAVRQNLLWGIHQCSQKAGEYCGQTFGADGYEIDYHPHPRPSHAEMGGRQYCIGNVGKIVGRKYFPPISEVEDLLDEYGCLHVKHPIICGVSTPNYTEQQLRALKAKDLQKVEFNGGQYTAYELSQWQRRLETAIRHGKDRQALAYSAGDEDLLTMETERLTGLKNLYEKVSDAGGLPTRANRLWSLHEINE